MNKEEIRIGNNILDSFGDERKIIEIRKQNYVEFEHGIVDNISECTPIKITADILKDKGFHFSKCGISGADMWQGMDFWRKGNILLRGNIKYLDDFGVKLQGYYNNDIKYLHRLQNLVYDLSGEDI